MKKKDKNQREIFSIAEENSSPNVNKGSSTKQEAKSKSKVIGKVAAKTPPPKKETKDKLIKIDDKKSKKLTQNPGKTDKKSRQEIFIPISGFVWLYPEEIEVINHPAFQRLGKIYQLGQTYLVYRGATHKRIEHVLGTLKIIHRMIAAFKYNHAKAKREKESISEGIADRVGEERFVRLGALLHDIGHVAAGHTLEDELGVIVKHDSDKRISLIFSNDDKTWKDRHDRTLEEVIDLEYASYIPDELAMKNITASIIARLLIRKIPEDYDFGDDEFKDYYEIINNSNSFRLSVCRDMIGNTICADLLDYLYRDWYHVGKYHSFDERILQHFLIKPDPSAEKTIENSARSDDCIVISLGKHPKIKTDAVSSILDLLESRYRLAESVLFHRTKLSATAMLDRALYELWGDNLIKREELENFVLPLSDEQFITECRKLAEEEGNECSTRILQALEKRELYKSLSTYGYQHLPEVREKILRKFIECNPIQASKNRTEALRALEMDFELPVGSIVMYCPSRDMKAKIAQVKISVNGEIDRFCDYDEKHDDMLSGGHLKAQLNRFKRLWKIYFFINTKVIGTNVDLDNLLKEAVEKLVLGYSGWGEQPEDSSKRIAQSLLCIENGPWSECRFREKPLRSAHRDDSNIDLIDYPFGALSLRHFINRGKE